MKRIVTITLLVFAITASLIAGTLASYNLTLDNMASGSVVAKEFIFMKDGTDSFGHGVKIAPTETVIWNFAVRNYDSTTVTETDLYYRLTFTVGPTDGKQAIDPLVVTIKSADGTVLKSRVGTGVIRIYDDFPLANEGQRHGYIVEIHWPSNPDIDIQYAGHNFGTKIDVSALASQVPIPIEDDDPGVIPGENPGGENPGGENPGGEDPVASDIKVTYWASQSQWQEDEGGYYNNVFNITIRNDSQNAIQNWRIRFIFHGQIRNPWSARLVSHDPATGEYVFDYPADYNKTINPGGSVLFGGEIRSSQPNLPISSVTVNGTPAELTLNISQ